MRASIRNLLIVGLAVAGFAGPGTAHANRIQDHAIAHNGYTFGLALTLGTGVYFVHDEIHRAPVSLEAVPSFGWTWFKFDLGTYITFEHLKYKHSRAGHWTLQFRPGGRLTPPFMPVYFRLAFPLSIQAHHLDFGVLFGVGVDIPIYKFLGLVFEIDTTLSKHLEWGGLGAPVEFRGGVSFWF